MGMVRHNLVLLVLATGTLLVSQQRIAHADSQVTFMASVDKARVPLDEQLKLTITMAVPDRNKSKNLKLPNTGSLKVLGTSREQSMSFSFSGGTSKYRQFTNTVLTLKPTKKGRVVIGPAILKYGGQVYKTEPLTILVTAPMGRNQRARVSPLPGLPNGFPDDDWFKDPLLNMRQEPPALGEKDIFVRAFASPDLVSAGQQLTVTLIVYSRVGAHINAIRWPKLDPFYTVDRDVSNSSTEEKYIDGVRYQYKILARKALFPMTAGQFTLGPIEVDVDASASPFFPSDSRTLRTKPIKIKVEPLGAGAPAGFHDSNVGRFSMKATVDSTEVKLNQPVTLTITIRGKGNIQNISPPDLPKLDKFKVFDPTVDVKQSQRGITVKGSKTVEYILLPLSSGVLTIPSLSFSFYDPEQGLYRTLKSKEININVSSKEGHGLGSNSQTGGREINIVAGAFKPIRFESSLQGYGTAFYKHPLFLPILLIPPFAYLLLLLFGLIRNLVETDSPRSRIRHALAESRHHWKKAKKASAMGKADEFYSELKDAILFAVEARIGRPAQGLTMEDLSSRLSQAGVEDALIEAMVREIENCDFGRFAPIQDRGGEVASAHERVAQVLKQLRSSSAVTKSTGRHRS